MPLDKLLRVQEVIDLISAFVFNDTLTVETFFIDVRDEALSQLFDVVNGYVNVHLLLCCLHEVVLWQAIVDYLLAYLRLAILRLDTYWPNVNCVRVLYDWAVRSGVNVSSHTRCRDSVCLMIHDCPRLVLLSSISGVFKRLGWSSLALLGRRRMAIR